MTELLAFAGAYPHDGWIGSWSPGIGDPTVGGWITVVVYLLAAVLCWRVHVLLGPRTAPRERWLWRGLLWLMVALGVNKQLDLQTALTEFGRVLAFEQGWYDQRRTVQYAFVLIVALLALAAGSVLLAIARGLPRPTKLAVAGVVVLFSFVAIRASSFHHIDQLLGTSMLGLRLNWVLELLGLSIICVGASKRVGVHRPAPTQARQVQRR